MDKLQELKEFFSDTKNRQFFIDQAKNVPYSEDGQLYVDCLVSNFIRTFLATENMDYALEFARSGETLDAFLYLMYNEYDGFAITDIELLSNKAILNYYIDVLHLSYEEAFDKFTQSACEYAYFGFSDNKHSTVKVEGLKTTHDLEEKEDIDALPEGIKNHSGYFMFYFDDSRGKINLARTPRIAMNYAHLNMPEWFRAFCTGFNYPYSRYLDNGEKEKIESHIFDVCYFEPESETRKMVKHFFDKYWEKYVENNSEVAPRLAIVRVERTLPKGSDFDLKSRKDVLRQMNKVDFHNFTICHDIPPSELTIIEIPHVLSKDSEEEKGEE